MRFSRNLLVLAVCLAVTTGLSAQSFENVPQSPQQPPPQPAPAAAPTAAFVAMINFQGALVSTAEGQAAAAALRERFRPMTAQLETLQQEIEDLRRRLREGQRTLSQEAQVELSVEIDTKTKRGRRLQEDLEEDSQRAQNELLARISEKMIAVISQYAQKNGISLVVQYSQQTPPLYVGPGVNITPAIVQLYDQTYPVAAANAGTAGN